jgi:hypothetical protein
MRRALILVLTGCTTASPPVAADVHLDVWATRYGADLYTIEAGADIGPQALDASRHATDSDDSTCTDRLEGDCVVRTCESTWFRSGGWGSTTTTPPIAPPLIAQIVVLDWALGPRVSLEPDGRGGYSGGSDILSGSDGAPEPGEPLHFRISGGDVLPTDVLLAWPGIPAPRVTIIERDEMVELSWDPPPIAVDRMEVALGDRSLFGDGTEVRCRVDARLGRVAFPSSIARDIDREEARISAGLWIQQEVDLHEGTRLIAHVSSGVIWLDAEW